MMFAIIWKKVRFCLMKKEILLLIERGKRLQLKMIFNLDLIDSNKSLVKRLAQV